ncbi:panB [Symbiodinium sp. CCMP2592]|nr:panB [Symbiodinium sp. CCMP2592]
MLIQILPRNEQYKCLITAAANWTKQYATEEGGDILSCWCTAQGYEALFRDQGLPFGVLGFGSRLLGLLEGKE